MWGVAWFRRVGCRVLWFGFLLAVWTSAPGWAVPAVQFSSPRVAISQLTAGGDVVLVYAGHARDADLQQRSVVFARLSDLDGDGLVTYDAGSAVVNTAVWAAIDLATGAVTVEASDGSQPTLIPVDPAMLTSTEGSIEVEQQTLHLLLVRPDRLALHASAVDGSEGDVGTADDGRVRLGLRSLRSVSTGFGARGGFSLQSGDVLVGIDYKFHTYFVTTVP